MTDTGQGAKGTNRLRDLLNISREDFEIERLLNAILYILLEMFP